ncbi:hypothetical protein [Kordiimonas sp. SCSIO 12610]|uniref:hypothetical protein n=1 Tax=Kordiimonas sp. SCSIO 12610 TaxID=2829597 RepID=UPI00210EB15F|nr:hypothetical protein [Kordiimonas sp. SCSIO 12610]UTW55764.1 hypothetical protein KFF44_02420 [Kordiimonas sp. SCSIO 12610]
MRTFHSVFSAILLFCLFGCAEHTRLSKGTARNNPVRSADDLTPVFEDYQAVKYRDLIANPEKYLNKHVTMLADPLLTVDYSGILNPEETAEREAFLNKQMNAKENYGSLEPPKHWLPEMCFSFTHNPDKIGRFHKNRAELIRVWGRLTSYTEVYPGSVEYQRAGKGNPDEDVIVTTGCKSRFVFAADTMVRIR